MAANQRWWMLYVIVTVIVLVASSDAQINPLSGPGCSGQSAPNRTELQIALDVTFSTMRDNLSSSGSWFTMAHSQQSSYTYYALAQCRNYMAQHDCLACYDAAVLSVRQHCCNDTGSRVYFDGCFLRYENYSFYQKTNENYVRCGTTPSTPEFSREVQNWLGNLMVATPRINDHFAAIRRPVVRGGNSVMYAVAQCTETVTPAGCHGCLTAGYEEMQQRCMQNTEGTLTDFACFMRYSNIPFFPDNQTMDITRYLPGGSRNNGAIIGGVAGGGGLAIILVSAILWYKLSRQMKAVLIGNLLGATKLQSPNRFSYEDLEKATGDFSEENKLGQGSFGAVYMATLKNGNTVAVKKLNLNYSRAKADFETEVRIISNAHHRNLVRLLGCCSKQSEMLLVYEYMENGSLDRFLYGDRRGTLSWKQRCDIISGTAKGIAYLHENYHVTVIHRDIKPGNILLDDEFQAKIADFGLVRLLAEDQTHVSTNFAGTLGYTAPEYATYGHLSEKVDIYSFGIVILEIISGRKCTELNMNSTDHSQSDTAYLLQQACNLYESGMHHNLADESLKDSDGYSHEEVKKLVEIALACTHSTPSSRPSMSEIIVMLLSDQPIKLKSTISLSESQATNATLSITDYTGR